MSNISVMNGNMAAAKAVALASPNVIAAYPITPQTPLVENLTQMKVDGEISSTMSEVESELSAMSVVSGASLAGSRTFTATSSQGLALMYEVYLRASTLRLPIVMNIVNREIISPQSLWGGPQDSLGVRDAGWIQLYVEDNQEILDCTYMAFKIAEDPRVLLPMNVCYDGFYLSHMAEPVDVPDKANLEGFLPEYHPEHVILDPERPMAVDPLTFGYLLTEYRYHHLKAQQNVFKVLEEVEQEFGERTGRRYTGPIEEYRMEDAEFAVVSMGSMSGAGKLAVDNMREKGIKVGLVRLRLIRPFPASIIAKALKKVKAFGVVDRNVSFGWDTGITYQEVNSALERHATVLPSRPFIAGLGGEDVTSDHFEYAIEKIMEIDADLIGEDVYETIWLNKVEGLQ